MFISPYLTYTVSTLLELDSDNKLPVDTIFGSILDGHYFSDQKYRRPCSDFTDMLRRHINCRIIIIIIHSV